MTTAQMRVAVHDAYPGKPWQDKVNNMSDIQVQAVYFSLLERGVFDKKPEEPKLRWEHDPKAKPLIKNVKLRIGEPEIAGGEQITFDI